jgi:hypothetical protein
MPHSVVCSDSKFGRVQAGVAAGRTTRRRRPPRSWRSVGEREAAGSGGSRAEKQGEAFVVNFVFFLLFCAPCCSSYQVSEVAEQGVGLAPQCGRQQRASAELQGLQGLHVMAQHFGQLTHVVPLGAQLEFRANGNYGIFILHFLTSSSSTKLTLLLDSVPLFSIGLGPEAAEEGEQLQAGGVVVDLARTSIGPPLEVPLLAALVCRGELAGEQPLLLLAVASFCCCCCCFWMLALSRLNWRCCAGDC